MTQLLNSFVALDLDLIFILDVTKVHMIFKAHKLSFDAVVVP